MLGQSWSAGAIPTTLAGFRAAYVGRQFGMFLHFNMATFTNVEQGDPASSPTLFAPSALSIDQWISTAQTAKMKYMVLTVKHSDGFCLWNTATTSHNVMNSPVAADLVTSFTNKCRAAHIAPVLYFSVLDGTMDNLGGNNASKVVYLEAQMQELLTNYGSIPALWIDWANNALSSPAPFNAESDVVSFIRGIQPGCLAIQNDHNFDLTKSDILVYEGGTRGDTVPGGNTTVAEYADTIQSSNEWFRKASPSSPKSAASLLAALANCKANNAAYLINCPPDTTGQIPSDTVSVLTTVGASL